MGGFKLAGGCLTLAEAPSTLVENPLATCSWLCEIFVGAPDCSLRFAPVFASVSALVSAPVFAPDCAFNFSL